MIYRTRKLIKPEDLNSRGTLFGGQLLKWIDEEASIYTMCQLTRITYPAYINIVTKGMSEINFLKPAKVGDIIEIGCELIKFGTTSISIRCEVRNKQTGDIIINIEKITFVLLDEKGRPTPHGFIN